MKDKTLESFFYDSIFICGDIHGHFDTLLFNIKQQNIREASVIVAGDCGIGFNSDNFYHNKFAYLNHHLEKRNIILYFVRGNHDNPEWFNGEKRVRLSNLMTIPDYSTISIGENNFLCVGGAVSIDRLVRMMWKQTAYWPDEVPTFCDDQIARLDIPIHVVVSHTAPSCCFPRDKNGIKNWIAADPSLEIDITTERMCMDKVLDGLLRYGHPAKEWFYGHFHNSCTEEHFGITFKMLNEFEMFETKALAKSFWGRI